MCKISKIIKIEGMMKSINLMNKCKLLILQFVCLLKK